MSVKEKAKAFEGRQSSFCESPPLRKKSREEFIGNSSDDSDPQSNSSSTPIPPPRRYKKNGTLSNSQSNDSSPPMGKKEKSQVIAPSKPVNSNSLPTKQNKVTDQKKKKPKPPPPPRGSSLGRKTSVPDNLKATTGGKKPKPPVPPKPKNYVPKRKSLLRDVGIVNNEIQPAVQKEVEKVSCSDQTNDLALQFDLNAEEGNCTEKVSEISVPTNGHYPSDKPLTFPGDSSPEEQIPSRLVPTNTNGGTVNGLEKDLDLELHENDLSSSESKTISSDNKILPGDIISGNESPDPLENLEFEARALSEEEDDSFVERAIVLNKANTPLLDSKGNEEGFASDGADDVLKRQFSGEESLSESDSTENVKVVYSVVLEEVCSVTMIKDQEEKKLDDVAGTVKDDFVETVEGKKSEDFSELCGAGDSNVDSGACEDRVEMTENIKSEDDYENVVAETFEPDMENHGNNSDGTGESVLAFSHEYGEDVNQKTVGSVVVEESSEENFKHEVSVEVDVQLFTQDSGPKYDEFESDEILVNTSTDLVQNEVRDNGEVIIAEPIREGTFVSVSDHAVTEGKAEVDAEAVEEIASELKTDDKSETKEKEEWEDNSSLLESEIVSKQDVEVLIEQGGDKHEDNILVNAAEVHSNLDDLLPEEKYETADEEINQEEKSGEYVLDSEVDEDVTERELVEETTNNIDSVSGSAGLEEITIEKDPSESLMEGSLLQTAEDALETPLSDVGDCSRGFEDVEITATHVEVLDSNCKPDSKDNETENEMEPPSSELVPLNGVNLKTKQGKHTYENVDFDLMVKKRQIEEKRKSMDGHARRSHSFSKYEAAVYSTPYPVQRVSDDEAIYRVPRQVISVHHYHDDNENIYSTPCVVAARCVVQENEYSVPKPILVQDVGVYAVPSVSKALPVADCTTEGASSFAQGSDGIYAVPRQENETIMATTLGPPPKPPRTSLDSDKKDKSNFSLTESPKPVPRMRVAVGDQSPIIHESRSSPTPVPRKGSKNEAPECPSPKIEVHESSPSAVPWKSSTTATSVFESKEPGTPPSPVPRKTSKLAQATETSDSPLANDGSPSPIPRRRVNALVPQVATSAPPGVTPHNPEIFVEGDKENESGSKRKIAPPRPPPPVNRISIVSSDSAVPALMSPGNDLESDSDSDVEQNAPKGQQGPPKPKTYYIAHEILSTERSFVDALKLVFEECYGTIKAANVVADSVLSDIFRDLENIYLLDSRFLQELEERMVTWEEHERIGDIIKKYGHFLKMYTQYVNGYDKAMDVFQVTVKENAEFANLVTQFQASKRCHGLVLSSYMLKPVQRIPSYRLLLIDYLKHLPKDSEEFADTETTLKIVSEVATHINESMKKLDSFEQLLKLQNMLVGNPEIVKAGRDYLKEGMLMKLCRKDMQERMFFLLTDVLLYTTPIGGNQYKLNKMLPLLGMQVTVPDSPDFVNEFSIISTTRSFTLTAGTPEERDEWVEALNKAIDVVTKRKITFANKARHDSAGVTEQETEGTTKLGEKAPVWIPDARVTMCMSCTKTFTAINRRHHCRACGNVVCGSCSENTAPLAYLNYTQARVCDKCYDVLLKEFHTDEMHVDLDEEPATLPPLLQESDEAERQLRKPTKFEIMRRFKSRKTKRKSHIFHPTHLTEVAANQEGIQMSGYLRYKKGRYGWKKSWFVLKDNVLYSYKASSDVVALETLPVLGYAIEDVGKEGDDFVFQLKHKGVPPIVFKADNENSAKRWTQELRKATTMYN